MRIDLLEAFGLEPKIITVLKQKYGETLIGELLTLHHGSRGKRALYLVPIKALAECFYRHCHKSYANRKKGQVIITSRRLEKQPRQVGIRNRHKHRIISRIKKAAKGTTTVKQAEIKKLIVTEPRIGCVLNMDRGYFWALGG